MATTRVLDDAEFEDRLWRIYNDKKQEEFSSVKSATKTVTEFTTVSDPEQISFDDLQRTTHQMDIRSREGCRVQTNTPQLLSEKMGWTRTSEDIEMGNQLKQDIDAWQRHVIAKSKNIPMRDPEEQTKHDAELTAWEEECAKAAAEELLKDKWAITLYNTDGTTQSFKQQEEPDIEQLQEWVGGYVELFASDPSHDSAGLYVNEEGIPMGFPINLAWDKWRKSRPENNLFPNLYGPVVFVRLLK